MKRRDFITLLGSATLVRPFAAHALQPAMPVIGFLNSASADGYAVMAAAFRQGLKEAGYVEGDNLTIVYRFAENQIDRLPALAADLVRHRAAVIATAGDGVAVAAKAATTTIPIVFIVSQDPVPGTAGPGDIRSAHSRHRRVRSPWQRRTATVFGSSDPSHAPPA